MSQPIEVDIAVGGSGDRVAFHLERVADVDPLVFVSAVQRAVVDALGATTTSAPVLQRIDHARPARFDPEAARARAAEAI